MIFLVCFIMVMVLLISKVDCIVYFLLYCMNNIGGGDDFFDIGSGGNGF